MKVMSSGTQMLPRPWLDALELPKHVQQGVVLAVAKTKKAATEALSAASSSGPFIGASLRVTECRDSRLLIEAGVIDPEVEGLWVLPSTTSRSSLAARINADGTATPVARFHYDHVYGGRGMWVEPIGETP